MKFASALYLFVLYCLMIACTPSGLTLEPGQYMGMGRQYILSVNADSTFTMQNVIGEKTTGYWRVQNGEMLLLPEKGQTDFLKINYLSSDSLNLGFQKGTYDIGFHKVMPPRYLTDSAYLVDFLKNGRLRYNSFFNKDPYEPHSIEFLDNDMYIFDNFYLFKYEIKRFNDAVFLVLIHEQTKVPFMLSTCSNMHADFKTYSLEQGKLINSTIKLDKPSDPGKEKLLKTVLHGTWGVIEDEHEVFKSETPTLVIDTAGHYAVHDGDHSFEGDWVFNRTADLLLCDLDKDPFVFGIRYFDKNRVIMDLLNAETGKLQTFKIKRITRELLN